MTLFKSIFHNHISYADVNWIILTEVNNYSFIIGLIILILASSIYLVGRLDRFDFNV